MSLKKKIMLFFKVPHILRVNRGLTCEDAFYLNHKEFTIHLTSKLPFSIPGTYCQPPGIPQRKRTLHWARGHPTIPWWPNRRTTAVRKNTWSVHHQLILISIYVNMLHVSAEEFHSPGWYIYHNEKTWMLSWIQILSDYVNKTFSSVIGKELIKLLNHQYLESA